MTTFKAVRVIALSMLLALPASVCLAQPIASESLEIRGMSLEIVNPDVQANLDTPSFVQTRFGGRINDEVAVLPPELIVKGELSGPGLTVPITLQTAPGRAFQLPGLSPEGTYYLQNVRLERDGQFVQSAFPSLAVIRVSNVFQTEVTVRQLTPDELRSRGILVDSSNYDVYEYTFAVVIDGQRVEIPFPVIVDPRTHQMMPVANETPYSLPPNNGSTPPRWAPPSTIFFELPPDDGELPMPPPEPKDGEQPRPRPSIPAAIVIPSDFAVLHQFFAVALMVQNGGEGQVRLDSITANIRPPAPLRVAGSNPPVAFGQPITIVDEKTGATFLVAKAQGSAEWTLEALKTGTHTFDIDVRATFFSPGQPDIPLRATPKATIVVHDPSFNVTFSHPDTVRKDEPYSTFAFVTNMSSSGQSVVVSSGLKSCQSDSSGNVCLIDGSVASHTLNAIQPGETRTIEYRLRPNVTGAVFATAAASDGVGFSAGVQLTMGVSQSGIPLSPATLVMPYYSRFLPEGLVSGNMRLLGLGYSLATAPVNQQTAKFPRVIRSDVFRRAVDIARAGQRVFITDGAGSEAALANLALDLLGNGAGNDLREWDQLRREEEAGRVAGASLARALEAAVDPSDRTMRHFFDGFVGATSHRSPFFAALVHGQPVSASRPYAIAVYPENSVGARQGGVDVPNEASAGWRRTAAWSELSSLAIREANPPAGQPATVLEVGELALIGRAAPNYHVEVTAAKAGPFTIDVVWPGAAGVEKYHATIALTAATDGQTFAFEVAAGNRSIQGDLFGSGSVVPLAPLTLEGARQDLHLDDTGHKVSVLFNRPVGVARGADGKPLDPAKAFEGRVVYDGAGSGAFHYEGPRPVFGAAVQEDGRIVNLTFDHVFSTNASYLIRRATPASGSAFPLVDALLGQEVAFTDVAPIVDNDRDAALLSGLVLGAAGEPLPGAQVVLKYAKDGGFEAPQVDEADGSGRFFFEYVPRDLANGYPGTYELRAVAIVNGTNKETKLTGAVRIPRELNEVNLSFLGRGNAEGYVRYDDGTAVPGARVVIGSTMFSQVRKAEADATGHYRVTDLPVGPLTFSAQDAAGNVTYAANELKSGGQTVAQDLSIYRQPFPGVGTVRGVVLRSDSGAAVAGAQVGVYSQGYPVHGGTTDSLGRFEFTGVPAGLVTILAADWSVSREAASEERDLAADSVQDLVLRLNVPPPTARLVRVHGEVVREDAFDPTKTAPVANALVKIDGTLTVTADANGNYVYESMPSTVSGRSITAWDPVTSRTGSATLDLSGTATEYYVPIRIKAGSYGKGSVRVLLLDAAGRPVTAPYFVLEPGIPPVYFASLGNGVYEQKDVDAGRAVSFVAVPSFPGPVDESTPDPRPFGDQYATGSALVAFPGHVASATLRLPGQGSVRAGYAPPTEPNQPLATGPMTISYQVWNHAEQGFVARYRDANSGTDGTGFATFSKVPALQNAGVEAYHPILGYASTSARLNFDGDFRTITLQAAKLSTIHGIVYAHDGMTPVAGAHVRLWDGRVNRGTVDTNPDGTFEFAAVAAGIGFDAIAEVNLAGIQRNGFATGQTPATGGPVDGVVVVLQKQGSVGVRVRRSDDAPSPFARVWVRELAFPYRSFGTSRSPLSTDANGQLVLGGVSAGDVRVSAYDRDNPDLTGNGSGRIRDENDIASITVTVGNEGTGTIEAVVVDPNTPQWDPVPNAEVALYKGGAIFDLATTDANGGVAFHDVPAGQSYGIQAYSKLLARSGSALPFTLLRDETHFERVVLEFSGKVSGTLRDEEQPAGEPREVAGAHVSLYASGYQSRATTGSGQLLGKFDFLGVREGSFRLEARDPFSWRLARGQGSISKISPEAVVDLTLEPTSTIRVSVWQPNDDGSRSSTLASVVAIEASQLDGAMLRSTQVNGTLLPGWLRGKSIAISVKEIGGQFRSANLSMALEQGEAHRDVDITLPAFGAVRAFVRQAGAPAPNARVTLRGKSLFTDATGVVRFESVPLGPFSVQARSFDERLTAYAGGTLASQTIPYDVTLDLGSYAAITGVVTAETGGPSAGTRVVANIGGTLVDQLTDASGRYHFGGIPATGSAISLCLSFFGPDGFTPGAPQKCHSIDTSYAGQTIEYNVTLDATRPYVVLIEPADGAQGVSRDAIVRVTFSEEIQLNPANYQLWQVDADRDVQVPTAASHQLAGGVSTVVLTPSRELDSQKLHRIFVSGDVSDRSGLELPAPRGATFITTDYKGPSIVATVPDYNAPIAPAGVFKIRFNEVVETAAGGFGVSFVDLASGTALGATPTFALEDGGLTLSITLEAPTFEAGHSYAMTLRGVQDANGNALLDATRTFRINDTEGPTLVLQLRTANRALVAVGTSLIERLGYNVAAVCTNSDGTAATDIARVEFVRKDISAGVNDTAAPFEYVFVAPQIPESGTATVILEARAYDTSGNPSSLVSAEWPVTRDLAPRDVVVTPAPASTAYPGGKLDIAVTWEDESPATVTTRLVVTGTRSNDQSWSVTLNKADAVTFEPGRVLFRVNVPSDLKPATDVVMAATITDVAGQAGSGEARAVVAVDPNPPEILYLSVEPQKAEYLRGEKFRIRVRARDLDSGVAELLLAFDGKSLTLTQAASIDSTTRTWEFLSGEITVPAKNADTDVTITATAKDFQGNSSPGSTVDIRYKGIYDTNPPQAAWICPIEDAMLPANKGTVSTTLRMWAKDANDLSVTFSVPGVAEPLTATREGSSDYYGVAASLVPPTDLTASYVIVGRVSDGDGGFVIDVPVSIRFVDVDVDLKDAIQAITASNVATFEGKTVAVRGSVNATTPARLVLHTPVRLKNLLVLDGAVVDTIPSTASEQEMVDLQIAENLYVDCSSRIDGDARGHVGGWAPGNSDSRGRTIGNTNDGGASHEASASHGGLGGESAGAPNGAYGSLSSPADLGSGGGGSATNSGITGGQGGGAIRIVKAPASTARFMIGGRVSANGASGVSRGGAGSGGSVFLQAARIRLGPGATIAANGGDDDDHYRESRGGGGGRIALDTTELLDLGTSLTRIEARGGRNGSTAETTHVDGGAGTIFLRKPAQSKGELIVSSFDSRHPQSAHKTMATPLAGTLDFDALGVGPRALARADADLTIAGVTNDKSVANVDPTGVLVLVSHTPSLTVNTTPASGGNLRIGANLGVTYEATSPAGIRSTTLTWSLATGQRVDRYFDFPSTVTLAPISFAVPADAQPGPVTLQASALDRAGRQIDLTPMSWNVVSNELPAGTASLASGTPAALYPGKSFTMSVQASDAEGLAEVRPRVVGAAVATPSSVAVSGTSALATFNVIIDKSATADSTVTVGGTVIDSLGGSADTNDVSVGVLADTGTPSIVVAGLATTGIYYGGQTVQATITVTDEVGASEVVVDFDGASTVLTGAGPVYVFAKTIDAALAEGRTTSFRVTATDYASHTAQTEPVTIQLRPDAAPSISLGSIVPSTTPLAGATIGATASLTDDVGVVSVTFKLTGAVMFEQTRAVNNRTLAEEVFTYVLPTSLNGGDQIQLQAIATDTLGHATPATPVVFTIATDTTKPVITSITVSAPPTGTEYRGGDSIAITASATDDVGLKLITLRILDTNSNVTSATSPAALQWTAPPVTSTTTYTLEVKAEDESGNVATASRSIIVQPLNNAGIPTIAFSCPSMGAYLPAGYDKFVMTIVATDDIGVQSVEFYRGDETVPFYSPTISGSPKSYTATTPELTLPAASSEPVKFRARVFDSSSPRNSRETAVEIRVVETVNLTAEGGNDWTYLKDKIAVLRNGRLAIDATASAPKKLAGLIVLRGATVTHSGAGASALALEVTNLMYVECGGSIDASGLGYGGNASYPGATVALDGNGGSHIGQGGLYGGQLGSTYGSLYRPMEYGAGGDNQTNGGRGGGVVRIDAGTLVVDGAIGANGINSGEAGGAGGSVWITGGKISGGGRIEANGGPNYYGEGGGGAVAIEYTDETSVLPTLRAHTGIPEGEYRPGGPGSVYVKGPASTYGELTIDNNGHAGQATVLPSLGSGLATTTGTGALVTDRSSDVPGYFVGHWVEVRDAAGTLKGTWRIASIDPANKRRVVLAPNGTETISIQTGDKWQGVYRFDDVKLNGAITLTSVDPIRLPSGVVFSLNGPTGSNVLRWTEPLAMESVVVSGNVWVNHISVTNLTVNSGAVLTPYGSGTLTVSASGTLTVNGVIDANGLGYGDPSTYPGGTGALDGNGGSHIGQGGLYGGQLGSTYGSVYRPMEYGARGDNQTNGGRGGGAVRIDAGTLVVNGTIRANGANAGEAGGAGGSVWITSGKISGGGRIEANGGPNYYGEGGGGAVAIEYTDETSVLPTLRAHTGIPEGEYRPGGAGSVYVEGPQNEYGALTVDNQGHAGQVTELPSLGLGLAKLGDGGAVLVTDRATDIPAYFVGHWVEVRDPANTVKGIWRIASIDGTNKKKVTLAPNGSETISIQAGDKWQGVYRFDWVDVKGSAKLASPDPILAPNYDRPSGIVALATGQQASVLAGSTINVDLSASDVQGLTKVVLKASGPVVSGSLEQTKLTGIVTSYSTQFQVAVLASAALGSVVTVWAEIYDNTGTVTRTASLSVGVLQDTVAPTISSVVVSPASADSRYVSGTPLTIAVEAADNVAVTSVSMEIAGVVSTDTQVPYQFNWSAPPVLADTQFQINVTAADAQGLRSTATPITITITPADGGQLPQVAWTYPSVGAQVPAGYPIKLGVAATDDVGVVKIEIFEQGVSQAFFELDAPNTTTKSVSAEASITLPAQPGTRTFRVRVYDISPAYLESTIQVESVTAIPINASSPDWAALEVTPGVLASGTLVVNSPRTLAGLFVLGGAAVRPPDYSATGNVTPLKLTLNGPLWVEHGGSIDADGRGYNKSVNRYGTTWPNTTTNGSYNGAGGSHGGQGGGFANYGGIAGSVYGSVYLPTTSGAAGGSRGSCTTCSPAGGIVTMSARSVTIDGSIRANGGDGGDAGGAAGGSILIVAKSDGLGSIRGLGTISANGGHGHAGGGGGRVTLIADDVSLQHDAVTALAGKCVWNNNWQDDAAPGTVYVSDDNEDVLLVKADEVPPRATTLPSLGTGSAASGSGAIDPTTGATILMAGRSVPAYFVGHWIEIRDAASAVSTWRIRSIDSVDPTRVLLDHQSGGLSINASDTWTGVYHFGAVQASGGARVESADRIYVDNVQLLQGCLSQPVPPPSLPNDLVWFDDAPPAGASLTGTWSWVEDQKASGSKSHFEPHVSNALHQHYFQNATDRLSVSPGDVLVAYVLLNPCDPPRQIILQFNSDGWEHRAYWGDSGFFPNGVEGTASRKRIGDLPALGEWVRLEVPAAALNLEGHQIHGMAFTLYDGSAWFDRAGKAQGGP